MGDYQKGTDILGDLFVETEDLTYVYNQGRCFEQNHRWEQALDRFREYQRKTPDLPPAEKRDIEAHIAECKSHLAEQPPVSSSAPTPPATAVTAASAAPPASEAPAAPPSSPISLTTATAPSAHGGQGSGLRIAGIAIGAVGVGAIVAGVVLAVKTGTLTDDLNEHYNRDKAATRDSCETWGWISYGVGAAALVTGAALYVLGWRASRAETATTSVSLVPTFAPGGAGLSLQGAY